jgi:hypothetical protein
MATHFSRLLRHAWVTVGLFLFPGHHTGSSYVITDGLIDMMKVEPRHLDSEANMLLHRPKDCWHLRLLDIPVDHYIALLHVFCWAVKYVSSLL